ncbi:MULTISPECIES: hypothetical protein [unclassified Streptomyces]|uniref:hypothetical protein n=1 Tax=unclassified Streptomyces TaxID=2593676 RepID=UPI00365F5F70
MAETIYLRGEGGGIHAMDLPLHESIADRWARGLLTRVDADGRSFSGGLDENVPAPEGGDGEPSAHKAGGKPAPTAVKAEWIAYVVGQGHMSADDAANLTKADLIDLAE